MLFAWMIQWISKSAPNRSAQKLHPLNDWVEIISNVLLLNRLVQTLHPLQGEWKKIKCALAEQIKKSGESFKCDRLEWNVTCVWTDYWGQFGTERSWRSIPNWTEWRWPSACPHSQYLWLETFTGIGSGFFTFSGTSNVTTRTWTAEQWRIYDAIGWCVWTNWWICVRIHTKRFLIT